MKTPTYISRQKLASDNQTFNLYWRESSTAVAENGSAVSPVHITSIPGALIYFFIQK